MQQSTPQALLQPPHIYPVAYQLWHNAAALFAPFASEPWAILLDSAQAEHPDGRYDILVRQPFQTICLRQQQLHCQPELATPARDIFHAIELALHAMPTLTEPQTDLPFTGGAVGYLGYAANAQQTQQTDTTFPLPDAAIGLYHHAVVIDHQEQRSYLVAPQNFSRQQAEQFWQVAPKHHPVFRLTSSWQSNLTQAEYYDRVQQFQAGIPLGKWQQINLAQRFHARCEGSSWFAYDKLRLENRAPFSGFVNLPEGAVLSFSPERFLQVDHTGQVQAKPIKGTRPRHSEPQRDQAAALELLHSNKERTENLMIVELLSQELRQVCEPASVRAPEQCVIESFPAVHHLVSRVTGQLAAAYSTFDLLRTTFPGGSITGQPKAAAMALIAELEPDPRAVYCGSLVYFSKNGASDTSITIRTLCHTQGHLYCWSGGGLMAESNPAEEYQETFDKVARILPFL